MKHARAKMTVIILIFVFLSFLLFSALYQYDNKYTGKASQAINGYIYISSEDMEKYPLRFLIHGWRYYPDLILTPRQLESNAPELYRYVSIGQYTNFAMGDRAASIHGCGTYVMSLHLPDEKRRYALELTDIFSAYRLYINGEPADSMGEIDADRYSSQVGRRLVTFEASGKTMLMLSVRSNSWLYAGMVYPPAFGEVNAVERSHNLKVGAAFAFMALDVFIAAAFLMFSRRALKQHRLNTWLFLLLNTVILLFSGYSVRNSFFSVPVQPYLSLEMISGHVLTLLIIIMHNRICRVPRRASTVSISAAITMCILSVTFCVFIQSLTHGILLTFSNLFTIWKFTTVTYFLICAFLYMEHGRSVIVLLFGDIFYAACLLCDRIYPDYEPVIGGWMQEWGSLGFIICFSVILFRDIAMGYRKSIIYEQERRQMERQLHIQVTHLNETNRKIEANRRMRHDFRQHIHAITALADSGNIPELQEYISCISREIGLISFQKLAANVQLDALLQYYRNLAVQNGIAFRHNLKLPEDIGIPSVDLCSLIGNLLENAMEACLKQNDEQPHIFISAYIVNSQLFLMVSNSFSDMPKMQDNKFLSSKHKGFGIGTESVRHITKQYNGIVHFTIEENLFNCELLIPVSPGAED